MALEKGHENFQQYPVPEFAYHPEGQAYAALEAFNSGRYTRNRAILATKRIEFELGCYWNIVNEMKLLSQNCDQELFNKLAIGQNLMKIEGWMPMTEATLGRKGVEVPLLAVFTTNGVLYRSPIFDDEQLKHMKRNM